MPTCGPLMSVEALMMLWSTDEPMNEEDWEENANENEQLLVHGKDAELN